MHYMFTFADDPTSVTTLTLTFSDIVLPEFPIITAMILLMLIASIIVIIKKLKHNFM